ncbi:MAG: cyclic nucleotide-binding domain-containing protein [Proteobacteria bacterium]|nr:cyclic nucleotide-binding domain-containing protein [Pseudomonadota bacterium]MBU1649122.1 cyclic nucleotide-binding domain-containing protein [Pseudomonadota bacterium]
MNNPLLSGHLAGSEQKSCADVFAFLGAAEQKRFASVVTERTFEQDTFLFEVGDPADEVFFLAQGRLSVQKKTGFHRKMQVVAILEPGAIVGEAGLLSGHIHGVSVRAIEQSHLFRLGCHELEALERTDSQLVIKLLKHLLLISSLRLEKTAERLAHVL